ncbi:IS5/IS1182 family transposase, partial [Salmonella enterica subsp. enterica]|nr:IS5/IS1182 family transposase [Salmonella enterica subsp. enterica]
SFGRDLKKCLELKRVYLHNDVWKKKVGYHRRSVAETAMFRIKTLPGSHLSLRDYDAQVGEALAMVKALNRMTLLGMPDSIRIA